MSKPFAIARMDHVVIAVADVEKTLDFYIRVLGMRPVELGNGYWAVHFGQQKINIHPAGRDDKLVAKRPTIGAGDICFVTETPIADVIQHLEACGIAIEEGPGRRTGALGPITSVYVRDPDGNLIEVSNYEITPTS